MNGVKIHLLWQLYECTHIFYDNQSSSLENLFKCAQILCCHCIDIRSQPHTHTHHSWLFQVKEKRVHTHIIHKERRAHVNLNRSKTLFRNYVRILNAWQFLCWIVRADEKEVDNNCQHTRFFFFFIIIFVVVVVVVFFSICWSDFSSCRLCAISQLLRRTDTNSWAEAQMQENSFQMRGITYAIVLRFFCSLQMEMG